MWFKHALNAKQPIAMRPERAEAPSPGQRPGYYDIQTNAL